MAELNERDELEAEQKRRFPDPVNLVAGLLTLWVAVYALSDGRLGFTGLDPRWVIAGIALLVGVLLLGASLRPGRRRQR
ncbi:MAG TPA: hypothetical protein VHV49_13475 [Pseudonocardiaceae bacterium]|nr:hypothetical protein [Pseudonocardiaceae bacterium]